MSDRKRISRACDSCNALRTKCHPVDARYPCQHCLDTGTPCEFNRVRKKRGKAAATRREHDVSADLSNGSQNYYANEVRHGGQEVSHRATLPTLEQTAYVSQSPAAQDWANSLPSPALGMRSYDPPSAGGPNHNGHYPLPQSMPSPMGMPFLSHNLDEHQPAKFSQNPLSQFPSGPSPHLNHPFNLPPPVLARPTSSSGNEMNNLNRLFGPSAQSPRSLPGQSPLFGGSQGMFPRATSSTSEDHHLKYPVLAPHLHDLHFVPRQVLCDLLDTYFDNSPYVFGYVVRRASVLHRLQPRKTSTALVYAMLCGAAHTCEHPFLSSTPVARAKVVQRLFEMAVTALRPLQHDEIRGGGLDDVITYMQLGTIIAASEFKGVSLRWFHSAWTLAKELHLNRELTGTPEAHTTTEITKEERRRTWWLLYMIDRHLCLCYNKPLCFTDVECAHLYHPISDSRWTSDEDWDKTYDSHSLHSRNSMGLDETHGQLYEGRSRGPAFEVQGPGVFGFFLPLTVILGEICTLFMLKRFHLLAFDNVDYVKSQVQRHLAEYERSLARFDDADVHGQPNLLQHPRQFSENAFLPYARQLMHTMHIRECPPSSVIPSLTFEQTD